MCVMIRQSDKGKMTRTTAEREIKRLFHASVFFNRLELPGSDSSGTPHVSHQFQSYTSALTWFVALSSTIPDLTGNIFLFLVVTQAHLFQ